MCKVMIMTGLENSPKAVEFMKAAAKPMSRMDRDGIGYSAINSQNKLFMQKWHNNDDFLRTDTVIDAQIMTELAPYQDRLKLKENYASYGEVTLDDLKTVTMHTRWATCGREFENTHPFIDQETSLIHNGTINNCTTLNLNKVSTCDSEAALQVYLNNQVGVNSATSNVQKFIDTISGYWAFGILAKDESGQYILDVLRESAQLYFCRVSELGKNCYVFATTQDIIKDALKETNMTSTKIEFLKESYFIRFDALNGEIIKTCDLEKSKSNGKSYSNYSKGSKTIEKDDYSYFNSEKKSTVDTVQDDLDYIMDVKYPIKHRLAAYDDFMSTDYLTTFKSLPEYVQAIITAKEKRKDIEFEDLVSVIEFHNKDKSIKDLLMYLNTKVSA